jgi:uncharacterized protein (TIGR01777 family)
MNILITGSSGLIGTALTKTLGADGHQIYPLVRNKHANEPFYWQPDHDKIHLDESIKIDAVIHLAGANIAEKRWNEQRKNEILNSRENGTRVLAEALSKLKNKPKLLISGSAIGYYGDTGDIAVDESSKAGTGFLAEVSKKWEQATQSAEQAGIRTVHMRTGIVLSLNGGILKQMRLPFSLGLGGIVGDGKQYLSCVSINDVIGMIRFLLVNESITGPVNLVSRNPVTNREFTRALGKALNRPTIFPLPTFIARIMFGEMADALLLSSTRVLPARLAAAGYQFKDDDLETTLKSLLDNKK